MGGTENNSHLGIYKIIKERMTQKLSPRSSAEKNWKNTRGKGRMCGKEDKDTEKHNSRSIIDMMKESH